MVFSRLIEESADFDMTLMGIRKPTRIPIKSGMPPEAKRHASDASNLLRQSGLQPALAPEVA